jgi:predicted CopG family antitoxin
MNRITISISERTRSKLKLLAGERSESEYARELLERAVRQDEVRAMAAQLRELPEKARDRDREIAKAMEKLRGW